MRKRLIDTFASVETNGIFSALNTYDVPWKDDIATPLLDVEYFYNISGQKSPSPFVINLLGGKETLSDDNIATLAGVLYGMYAPYWHKQYATLSAEYNPISNYDMTETETENGTTSNDKENTGTVQTTDTETASGTASGNSANNLYGFNSTTAVGDTTSDTSSSTTSEAGGTSTRTDNLKQTDSGTHSMNRTLTRSGNIGVTTTQQMLESERALWMWNFFMDVLFKDVDKVLTLKTYSNY